MNHYMYVIYIICIYIFIYIYIYIYIGNTYDTVIHMCTVVGVEYYTNITVF